MILPNFDGQILNLSTLNFISTQIPTESLKISPWRHRERIPTKTPRSTLSENKKKIYIYIKNNHTIQYTQCQNHKSEFRNTKMIKFRNCILDIDNNILKYMNKKQKDIQKLNEIKKAHRDREDAWTRIFMGYIYNLAEKHKRLVDLRSGSDLSGTRRRNPPVMTRNAAADSGSALLIPVCDVSVLLFSSTRTVPWLWVCQMDTSS